MVTENTTFNWCTNETMADPQENSYIKRPFCESLNKPHKHVFRNGRYECNGVK